MRTWKSRLRLFTHVKPSAFLLFPHFAINMLVKTCTMDRFLIKRSLALEHPYRVLFRPYYGRGKCFDLLRSVVNNWFLGLGGTKRQCRPKKNVFMTHPVLKENWTSFPLLARISLLLLLLLPWSCCSFGFSLPLSTEVFFFGCHKVFLVRGGKRKEKRKNPRRNSQTKNKDFWLKLMRSNCVIFQHTQRAKEIWDGSLIPVAGAMGYCLYTLRE